MNRWHGVGRLAADPIRRDSGAVIARIACPKEYKVPEGEQDAEFVDIVAFGPRADYLANYGKKGRLVEVTATVHVSEYTKDEKRIRSMELRVDNTRFLDSTRRDEGTAHAEPADAQVDEPPATQGSLAGY